MKKRILVALLAIFGSSVLLTAIPGEDSSSWSPYPLETEDSGDSLLGEDSSTWSPTSLEEQDVSDNGDSSLLGGDPSTWSPYPIEDSVSVVVNYEKDSDEDGTGMLYITHTGATTALVKLNLGESTSFTFPSDSLSDLVVWAFGRNDDGGFTQYNYIKKGFTDSDVNSDNEVVLNFSDDFTLQD